MNHAEAERSVAQFEVLEPATIRIQVRARDGRVFRAAAQVEVLDVIEHHQDEGASDEKPLFSLRFASASVLADDPDSALPEEEG